MKDFFNREFQIGDYFVFPVRHSGVMAMKVGVVVEFGKREVWKSVGMTADPTLIVFTARRHWNEGVAASSRVSVLMEPERAVITRREDVPQNYLDILDPILVKYRFGG